jgi:hypothetical protein
MELQLPDNPTLIEHSRELCMFDGRAEDENSNAEPMAADHLSGKGDKVFCSHCDPNPDQYSSSLENESNPLRHVDCEGPSDQNENAPQGKCTFQISHSEIMVEDGIAATDFLSAPLHSVTDSCYDSNHSDSNLDLSLDASQLPTKNDIATFNNTAIDALLQEFHHRCLPQETLSDCANFLSERLEDSLNYITKFNAGDGKDSAPASFDMDVNPVQQLPQSYESCNELSPRKLFKGPILAQHRNFVQGNATLEPITPKKNEKLDVRRKKQENGDPKPALQPSKGDAAISGGNNFLNGNFTWPTSMTALFESLGSRLGATNGGKIGSSTLNPNTPENFSSLGSRAGSRTSIDSENLSELGLPTGLSSLDSTALGMAFADLAALVGSTNPELSKAENNLVLGGTPHSSLRMTSLRKLEDGNVHIMDEDNVPKEFVSFARRAVAEAFEEILASVAGTTFESLEENSFRPINQPRNQAYASKPSDNSPYICKTNSIAKSNSGRTSS